MSLFDQFDWQGSATGLYPWFWGTYWLGPTTHAPVPNAPGLTDTVTGAVWYLTINTLGDHIVLTTQKPPGPTRVLPASDYLIVGQSGYGMQIVDEHITLTQFPGLEGPGPFAPNSQSGIPTLIAGLFMTHFGGPPTLLDHLAFQVATIRAIHTPSAPTQIAQPVAYNTYYTELQDNSGSLP